ncbi:MAG: DUF3972 domain-containing protein, partial [Campylobacterota bacterium]|nr:DUF3972 domain-containing protein [Campylobacterota bacterium]
ISRQAVYAKVKRGILQSKSVDGKLYIVVDEKSQSDQEHHINEDISVQKQNSTTLPDAKKVSSSVDYEMLLQAKDETIGVLKGTVKDLKKSNKQMSTTLRGEIDLLKDAFHEMRTIYVTQIEQIRQPELPAIHKPIDVTAVEPDEIKWISLKKFFKKNKISKTKKQENMTKKLKKSYQKGDTRILVEEGEIKLSKREHFKDILS